MLKFNENKSRIQKNGEDNDEKKREIDFHRRSGMGNFFGIFCNHLARTLDGTSVLIHGLNAFFKVIVHSIDAAATCHRKNK